MMKKKLLPVLQAVVFFALLLAAIVGVSWGVERKQSRNQFGPFFQRPQDMDILFLGDSHVVNGIFPMELWRDYGLTGYNMACYGNTLPVSYWVMQNALDYAHPKLIVLGVKDVEKNYKVSGSSGDLHSALDCFPLTRTKSRAIEDLIDDPEATDDEGNRYVDMKWEYYIKLGKYHGRWDELKASDFRYEPNVQKGAEMAVHVSNPRNYDIIDDAMEESGWGFSYLRMIIEACERRGIALLLVHMPHPATEITQRAANTVQSIALEYGVNYVDLVNLDNVADYNVDCFDSFSHLNPSGARKVTDYLGRYIAEHYDLPDHRGEAQYRHWDADYARYADYKLDLIREQEKLDNLLMLLHDGHFSVCVSVRPGSPLYADSKLLTLMHNIARKHVFEEDAYVKWSSAMFPLEGLDEAAAQGARYFMLLDRKTGLLRECVGDGAELSEDTSFGRAAYRAQGGMSLTVERSGRQAARLDAAQEDGLAYGVQLLVVNDLTGEVAATLRF